MKKIFLALLFLQLLVLALMVPNLFGDERREFISKTMNPEVQKLLENCSRHIIGEEPFSSKNNNIMDYMIGFYDADYVCLLRFKHYSND